MSSSMKTRRFTLMALLITIALILGYFERFLPVIPVPGVKLGLANIVSLIALILLPFSQALTVVILRVVMLTFFGGSAMSFFYSFFGGIISLTAMYLTLRWFRRNLSFLGVSIIGAFFHNTAQMVVLGIVMKSFFVALNYYPVLILAAIAAGFLTGLVALSFFRHMNHMPIGQSPRFDIYQGE